MLPSEYYTNDSIIQLRIYKPLTWQADSSKLVQQNLNYYDSLFQDSNIKKLLPKFESSFITDTFNIKYDENLPKENEVYQKQDTSPKWLFIFVVILIILVTLLKLYNQELFKYLFNSIYSNRACENAVGETETNGVLYHLYVMLTNSLMFALVIFYISNELDFNLINTGPIAQILVWMLIVVTYFFIKNLIYQILSNIFGSDGLFLFFNQINLSANFNIAFVFVPIYYLIFANFLETANIFFQPLTLVIIGILIIFKIIRMAILTRNKFSYSFLYLFLYLCALEIVPWLYFIGLVKRY